jgi:hypothetical protein
MFRRLPTLRSLSLAAAVGVLALASAISAQPPAGTKAPPVAGTAPAPVDGALVKRSQEENLKLFKRFADEVLRLAQKWEKSDTNDDKERAKALRTALKLIEEKGVEKLFKELIEGLGKKDLSGTDFDSLLGKDRSLMAALEQILGVLDTEDEVERLRREINDLKKAIEAIQKLKRDQENIRARTDNPKADPNKLAKDQNNLAKQTQDTADALNKNKSGDKNASGNAGPKQDPKSEPKPSDAKAGENAGEDKPDTKEDKGGDKPSGDGMGTPKDGDPKAGDSKPMGGDPKAGGMDKPTAGGDKPMAGGDPKAGPDKAGDPKPGDSKPMGGDPKGGDPKGGDPKGGDPKGGDPKGGDPKGGNKPPKGGEAKPQGAGKGDSKPSEGMPNAGEAKPMDGGGMPMQGGMPMGGQPQAGSPKPGGQQPPPGGQQPQNPNQPKDPAGENVQQAVPQQQDAEDNIKKGENEQASKSQDKAIQQLQKALEELEKRLKQLREKELAKLLANLEERVARMLRMQIEVKAATESVEKTVLATGGKPAISEIQKSQAEAEKEGAIIAEAEKTLKLMEGEGTAVVFAGILAEVKGDMEAIQKRLNEARVGKDTQQIEQDVIDQLTRMKEALKQAKQDLENKQNDPKPSDQNAGKDDKKLLDLINELKLIKAQQEQVNSRTVMHNKTQGEQAKDPLIQAELKQLSERQKKLQDMLHKIATQANQ